MLCFQDKSLCFPWQFAPTHKLGGNGRGTGQLTRNRRIHQPQIPDPSPSSSGFTSVFPFLLAPCREGKPHLLGAAFQNYLSNGKGKNNLHLFPKLAGLP